MAKSRDAFRTISEVSEWLDTPAHVLRFWESKFTQIKPVKRAGGRRYYRPQDMELLGGIKVLLHEQGMTIKGAQKLLRENGVKHVSGLSPSLDDSDVVDTAVTPQAPNVVTPIAPPLAKQPTTVPPAPAAATPAPASTPESAVIPPEQIPNVIVPPLSVVPPAPVAPSEPTVTMPIAKPAPTPRLLGAIDRLNKGAISSNTTQIAPLIHRLAALAAQMRQA